MPATPFPGASVRRSTLPDGRVLAWSEQGEPGGAPVVYCHGFPSSGREAGFAAKAAEETGVRLIAPDRPGFGGSSPARGRRINDWPGDLRHLLDALGIDRFRLLGVSGGGPYALACGALLNERVDAIALVGALGPLQAPSDWRRMSALARSSLYLAREHPRVQAAFFHLLGGAMRIAPDAMLRVLSMGGPPADRVALGQPGIRDNWVAAMRSSVRQGARPAIEELRLYGRPWPFRLADVVAPVRAWHGGADAVVPPSHCDAIAALLPDVQASVLPGEGHFSIPIAGIRDILRTLRSAEPAAAARG